MTAPEAFEKWWQALPLRNGEITADHIRQAWDAGVLFTQKRCAEIADNGMLVPPDGGSPTQGEIDVAERIAYAIRNTL